MKFLSFVFLLTFSFSISAQSPTVSNLFSEGTNNANAGRFEKALDNFKTALFLAENEYLGAGYRARLHFNIGVCHFRLERFDQAANEFKHAIILKADYARAHYAHGMALMRKRAWKDATVSFTKVLDLDPKDGEAWFDLAFASTMVKDFETAERAFARAIEFGSTDAPLSHNNIGVILAIRGDLAGAEKQFETAISVAGGGLIEARRNLEFCKSKRATGKDLLAGGEFHLVTRQAQFL